MTASASTIKKSIKYVTNKKGEKVAIQFNLKNAQVQQLVEDLLDTLTAIERHKDPKTSLAQAKKDILGS